MKTLHREERRIALFISMKMGRLFHLPHKRLHSQWQTDPRHLVVPDQVENHPRGKQQITLHLARRSWLSLMQNQINSMAKAHLHICIKRNLQVKYMILIKGTTVLKVTSLVSQDLIQRNLERKSINHMIELPKLQIKNSYQPKEMGKWTIITRISRGIEYIKGPNQVLEVREGVDMRRVRIDKEIYLSRMLKRGCRVIA